MSEVGSARVRLFGQRQSREAYEIRDYLTRSVVDFEWVELDSDEMLISSLPIVEFPDGHRLEDPTLSQIAHRLGWVTRPTRREYDLSIYGAGPAGLSAAVYAASEGLSVVVLEQEAVGGQAGSSSLIENYLGFPNGIRGAELAERARQQAVAFGAELLMMRQGIRGEFHDDRIFATLADGSTMIARANICATGVKWRRLGLPLEAELIGRGLYYGAGTSEGPQCSGERIIIVGGGNSAGQAVLNLAAYAEHVTMIVRGTSLSATLSNYLAARISSAPNVAVLLSTEISALHGESRLESVSLRDTITGEESRRDASLAFVCIGGSPDTDWAADTPIVRDQLGYLVTGPDLTQRGTSRGAWPLERDPFYLETSVPGSFAAGDVRHNSVKRVASAVGEGAMAVTFAHRYLAETN